MKNNIPVCDKINFYCSANVRCLMNILCLGAIVFLNSTRVYADPIQSAPATKVPENDIVPKVEGEFSRKLSESIRLYNKKGTEKDGRLINEVTLDYDGATPYSNEVLNANVTLKLTQASFLSALEAVLAASAKTCRVECRRISPVRVTLDVKDVPVAGLLDSLAKLGSARLYVLPSKLIIAPESALSSQEKKDAKPYGVLLSSTTLNSVGGADVLAVPNKQGKSILDLINTPISANINNLTIDSLTSFERLKVAAKLSRDYSQDDMGQFGVRIVGPILLDNYLAPVSMNLKDVRYGDALASLAHLLGCELYIAPTTSTTGTHFVMCPTNKFPEGKTPELEGQPLFPVFAPSSVSFSAPELSGGKS